METQAQEVAAKLDRLQIDMGMISTCYSFSKKAKARFSTCNTLPVIPEYIKKFYRHQDPDGRVYQLADLGNPAPRPTLQYTNMARVPTSEKWLGDF